MENLPSHLLHEILFLLPHKSLARLQCVNRAFRSRISEPEFRTEYLFRVGTGLIHISASGSDNLGYVPYVSGDTKTGTVVPLRTHCRILGSVSGLVLLYLHRLCVVNPITQTFQFLGKESLRVFHQVCEIPEDRKMRIGFGVDQIDRTTQRFRVVCIYELPAQNTSETRYGFEIYGDDGAWRVSKTKISCPSSDLYKRVKPVYLRGALHWLRDDGSVVVFSPETEHADLIQTTLPSRQIGIMVWLGAVHGKLTLASAKDEVVSVFALRESRGIPKWVLEKQIIHEAVEKRKWLFWMVVGYDGRFLVAQEIKEKENIRLLLGYDVVRANKWKVMGLVPSWMDSDRDFFDFSPSWSTVRRLEPCLSSSAAAAETQERSAESLLSLRLFMQMIDPHSS